MTNTHPIFSVTYDEPTDLIVCDPCYVITHTIPKLDRLWQKLCDEWYPAELSGKPSNTANRGIIRYDNTSILYSSTAHGDGTYHVSSCAFDYKGSIGVDAGMICVMKLEDAIKINPKIMELENIITIVRGFKGLIESTGEGFTRGLTVNTTDDTEEEDYDDE